MTRDAFELLEASFERCQHASTQERRTIIEDLERATPDVAAQLERMLVLPELGQEDACRLLSGGAWEESAAEREAKRRIGRYNLLGTLGEGGYGVVYLAEQPSPSHRLVAIKIIKPGMDTHQVLARFNDERQALALMDHPCVVATLDAGSTDDGRPYVVMPLIPGLPISSFCTQEALNTEDRLRIMVKVCRGIEHAHSKGVIHRDIKPGNILVARTNGEVLPRVIDFGLAKAMLVPLTAHQTVTLAGQIVGTPEYMSPEQAESSASADVRSDVYALGAVMYELIAGAPPISSERLRSPGQETLASVIRAAQPEAPSRKAGKRIGREVDWIILRCLEKEPGRRYQSAGTLADDIEAYLAGRRVVAGPPARLYRAAKAMLKHWRLLIAALLIIGTAAAGVAAVEQSRRRAVQLAAFTRSILTSVDPTVAQGRDPELLLMMLDEGESVFDDPDLDPRVELELRETFAIANRSAGRLLEAGVHAARADELIRRLEGEHSKRRIDVLLVLISAEGVRRASDATAADRIEASRAAAQDIAERHAGSDPDLPLKTKIETRVRIGALERDDLLATLAEAKEKLGVESRQTILICRMAGRRLIEEKNVQGTEMLEEARAYAIKAFGPDHPLVHEALSVEMLGAHLTEGGFARVAELGRERLADAERILGWRYASLPMVYNNLGCAHLGLGDAPAAVEVLRKGLDIEARVRTDESSNARWIRANLMRAALRADRMDVFNAAETRAFELEPEGPVSTLFCFREIIDLLRMRGDEERAAKWERARERHQSPTPS